MSFLIEGRRRMAATLLVFLLVIVLTFHSVSAQTNLNPENITCSVCGEGQLVSLPDAIFAFPGQPVVTCGQLEGAGFGGLVGPGQCPFLPALIKDVCGCTADIVPSLSISPSLQPSSLAPGATPRPVATPAPTPGSCSICGDGFRVSIPDALVSFPDQELTLDCINLQTMGLTGLVPSAECQALPDLVREVCGCRLGSITVPTLPPDPFLGIPPPLNPDEKKVERKSLSVGAIAGIVIGVALSVTFFFFLGFTAIRRMYVK